MKITIVFICTLFISACIQSPVNKSTKNKSGICSDFSALNSSKSLPCICGPEYEISIDKKSCKKFEAEEAMTRACSAQPLNTVGGEEISNDNGQTWSSCLNSICSAEAILSNDQCVIKSQERSCFISNGSGTQSTQDGGQSWNSCQVVNCNSHYISKNNLCALAEVSRSCIVTNGTGLQYSVDAGSTWGECIVTCKSGYGLVGGVCKNLSDTRSCLVENGSGLESTSDAGVSWSTCSVVACNTGYKLFNNVCEFKKVTRSCSILNGTGTQSQELANGPWSNCTAVSCNTGYTLLNNLCLESNVRRLCTIQPLNSVGGYELSQDAGQSWSTECKSFSCNSLSIMTNGQCILKMVETPILDLDYYVAKYEQLSISENQPSVVAISVLFSEFESSGILGTCTYSNPRVVRINQQWWNSSSTSNNNRQYVMYHELGHCVLSRTHKTDMTQLVDYAYSVPLSIMYPAMMSPQVYKNNMDYYHKELFDPTISTQNIPLYYYANTPEALMKAMFAPLEISSISKTSIIDGKIVCVDEDLSLCRISSKCTT